MPLDELVGALQRRDRYLGPLTDEAIASGAHKCFRNASSLLGDVRSIVGTSPGRAMALTILGLEEIGKLFALFDMKPDDPPERWRQFWLQEFARHSFKQIEATQYGALLARRRPSPYRSPVTPQLAGVLDSLKQQGLYVDFVSGRPQSPDEFAGGHGQLIDYLFAVAEERCDSLAQFHLTPERSAWFLSEVRMRKGGWPPPVGSAKELSGIVLSLASNFSATEPLDYVRFRASCELAPEIDGDARRQAVGSVMTTLAERLEKTDALLEANLRAVQMLKLVSSYMERLGDSDPTMENQPRKP